MTLESPTPEAGAQPAAPATYDDLVISALRVAALVLVTKFVAVVGLARLTDASATVTRTFGVVPRLNFSADPAEVSRIATLSTLAMAVVALLVGAWTVFRPTTSRQRVWGRLVAGVIALQTLGFEAFRHLQGDDTLSPRLALLVMISGIAAIALIGQQLWRDRTDRSHDHVEDTAL